jgi:hypothetical protein
LPVADSGSARVESNLRNLRNLRLLAVQGLGILRSAITGEQRTADFADFADKKAGPLASLRRLVQRSWRR